MNITSNTTSRMKNLLKKPTVVALVVCAALSVLPATAQANFAGWCGHGYISNGTVKDTYQSYYTTSQGHRHIIYSWYNYPGQGWIYLHSHDRLCG